jgi:hypothetical protein
LVVFWVSLVAPAAGLTIGLTMLTVSLMASGAMLAARVRSGFTLPLRLRWIPAWVYPLGLLAFLDAGVLLAVVFRGDPGWDGLFVWGIKARYFAGVGGVATSFFSDLSRQWSHLDYPFLVPLIEALAYRAVGAPSVRIDMVVAAAFAVCLLILFHELIRQVQGRPLAAILTLVLLTVPAFWSNAVAAYADLPQALYLLGGAGLVYLWFDHDRRAANVIVGGALLAFAVWVKRDALGFDLGFC